MKEARFWAGLPFFTADAAPIFEGRSAQFVRVVRTGFEPVTVAADAVQIHAHFSLKTKHFVATGLSGT